MIASKDSTDWIIACASRCGSSRLRTGLTQEAAKRPKNPVAEYMPPWQGGDHEEVPEYDLRIQVAREPIERWNSLFYYFRNVREQPPLEDRLDTFSDFMAGIVARNWTHYDCTPLTDHLEMWQPHRVVLLQDIDLLWEWIDAPFFWREYYYHKSSDHSNHDKKPVEATLAESPPLTDGAKALIEREKDMLHTYGAYDHDTSQTTTTPMDNGEANTEPAADVEFTVEEVPIDDLKPHPKNYREHPPEQIEQLKDSIRLHGIYKNVVTAQDLTILAGEGITTAASEMGRETMPIYRLDVAPDSPTAEKVLVGDNKLPERSTEDPDQLADLLQDLDREADEGLEGTGFTGEDLNGLLDDLDRIPGEDDAQDPFDKYTSKIESPTYEPTQDEPPPVEDLYDDEKTMALISEIEDTDLPAEVEIFLQMAAHRHTVFDFEAIAEYYAHAPPKVQRLMEASALVIIDFGDAIDQGFTHLSTEMREILQSNSQVDG